MSDQEYQERVWVRAEGPECDDIEDACDFFDEGYILEKYQEFGISEMQYKLLLRLHSKLRKFVDTYNVYASQKNIKKLISLPQWDEIRELSQKVVQSFNFKKTGTND